MGGNVERPLHRLGLDEKAFRYQLNDDAMTTEKLSDGIRVFARDLQHLRKLVAGRLGA